MQDQEFMDKLKYHPALRARFEGLLGIIENTDCEIALADEAEQRVVKEMRAMGQDALQCWANRQSGKVTSRVKENKTGMRKHVKKNSGGIPRTEESQ